MMSMIDNAKTAIAGLLFAGLVATSAQAAILTGADDPACKAAVAYSDGLKGASVLVLKDGKVICEAYSGEGAPDHGMEIWSGTKSFIGVMAAAAVQDGLLTLDEKVSDTITEWKDDPARAGITIRQVLTLTAGIPSEIGRPPPYAATVGVELFAPPGERFRYGPAPFQLFGEIMRRKLAAAGQSPDPYAYLKRRILDPIGLKPTQWRRLPNGDALLPQGAVMTAREWIKFGEFIRAGGKVDGKFLVDPTAFGEMFKGTSAHPGYGLTWWLARASMNPDVVTASTDIGQPGLPADLAMAAGAGNQRLYIIPSMGLTIVRQATFRPMVDRGRSDWSDARFLVLVLGQ